MTTPATTAFALCADDYGLTPGIGAAVRRLVEAGRLSAVSCLVTTGLWPEEAARLRPLGDRVEVGLHVNLSLGRPLAAMPRLAPDGRLPPLPRLIGRACSGRIDQDEIAAELDRQLDRFISEFGRPPDFLDGHEHVHQFPAIRAAVLTVCRRRFAPGSIWLRRSAMTAADLRRHPLASQPRALAISLLGLGFAARAAAAGFRGNRGFRGVRRFRDEPPYPLLFAGFVDGLAAGGLVMCHPGIVDDGDGGPPGHPVAARDEEFRFLMSDAFPALLARRRLHLAPLGSQAR